MQFPKISIVTPSFNQGKYIEQTIQSVINQNYPNLEYIIIDGGSTDQTIDVIKKYETYLNFWVSEKDDGQTDAINKGFAKCTGEIFNWINSDDYYEPGTFFKLAELFNNNPSLNVVCGKEWNFDDGDLLTKTLNAGSIIAGNIFETLRIGIIDQPCTFFRKKSIECFFPLDISLHYVMDRQLWWSYLLANGQIEILRVDDVFTNFRLHPNSKSINEFQYFEQDFDRLKYSLLQQLNAPEILMQQFSKNFKPVKPEWVVKIKPQAYILAAFASVYAEACYVREDNKTAAQLMKLVKKYRGFWGMNKKEKKLWMSSCLKPLFLLMHLKKVKNKI